MSVDVRCGTALSNMAGPPAFALCHMISDRRSPFTQRQAQIKNKSVARQHDPKKVFFERHFSHCPFGIASLIASAFA